MSLLNKYLMGFNSLGAKTQMASSSSILRTKLFSAPASVGGKYKKRGVDSLGNIISKPQVNLSLAKASRLEIPRVRSGLPFSLHNRATGNAVTRRMPKLNRAPSSPIRSRAIRYRG
jgi:hypothetical protein